MDTEGEAEPVGERGLLEDHEGLGVATRATQNRALRRDAVAESDGAVETAGGARKEALGISNGPLERSVGWEREREGPEARLGVELDDCPHRNKCG